MKVSSKYFGNISNHHCKPSKDKEVSSVYHYTFTVTMKSLSHFLRLCTLNKQFFIFSLVIFLKRELHEHKRQMTANISLSAVFIVWLQTLLKSALPQQQQPAVHSSVFILLTWKLRERQRNASDTHYSATLLTTSVSRWRLQKTQAQ